MVFRVTPSPYVDKPLSRSNGRTTPHTVLGSSVWPPRLTPGSLATYGLLRKRKEIRKDVGVVSGRDTNNATVIKRFPVKGGRSPFTTNLKVQRVGKVTFTFHSYGRVGRSQLGAGSRQSRVTSLPRVPGLPPPDPRSSSLRQSNRRRRSGE